MALLRRQKVAAPTPAPIAGAIPKPVKTVQVRRFTSSLSERKKEDAKETVLKNLKLISESFEAIDRAQAEIEAAREIIDATMRAHRLDVVENGKLLAEIVEKFTKQSRTVDPKKFRAKVHNDDFFKAISVTIAAAEQLLGEKELNEVCDVVRAKSLGHVLEIREIGKRKKL